VTASGAHRALALLKQYQFDFALLDVMMPGMSGLELLAEMRELHPDVGVIILTGAMELNGAITAMRDGAYDYVSKPIGTAELTVRVNGARERRRLVLENRRYQEEQKRLVAELDARQEQRTKELNALNRLFQTHVSSDLDAREAYEALRQAVSNFGAELERLAERAWLGSRPDSGAPEAVSASLPSYIAPAAGQRS
jgi:DNA-binding NtrC family response regulator